MALELNIVTPEGEAFSGTVDQVVLPGSEGDFGVLERHERYLAPLRLGAVEIQTESGSQWAAVTDGFADVSAEHVVVMVDSCRIAADIDVGDAERERSEAEAALRDLSGSEEDQQRRVELEAVLARANLYLEVATRR